MSLKAGVTGFAERRGMGSEGRSEGTRFGGWWREQWEGQSFSNCNKEVSGGAGSGGDRSELCFSRTKVEKVPGRCQGDN